MELSWTTLILEIVNFLVLVWILKRFLYKPVLTAIAQRKAAIDKTLSDAQARQTDAQALEEQYRNRLADWENEKEKLRAIVLQENNAQRVQLMAALQDSLAQERERERVLAERRLNELKNRAEEEGIAKGVQFTAHLLARCASPEVEARLAALALEDLPLLPSEQLQTIRAGSRGSGCPVKVSSAFTLSALQRSAVVQKLEEVTQSSISVEFSEDPHLLAGLRISLGPWVLRANLEDELGFFANAVRHDA